jgi:hypothetical protein
MYGHMKQLGAPITFQTATTGRIGDWQAALQAGLAYGAGSIELPYGYTSWPVSDLMGMQQRFPR